MDSAQQSSRDASPRIRDPSPDLATGSLGLPNLGIGEDPTLKQGSCRCQACRKKQQLFEPGSECVVSDRVEVEQRLRAKYLAQNPGAPYQDLPYLLGQVSKKPQLPYLVFPDVLFYSYGKPSAYLYFERGVLRKVLQKERLQYSELVKTLVDRDKQLAEDEARNAPERRDWLFCHWRIVYTDGAVEHIPTNRLVVNFSKSRVGRLTGKEIHYLIREVPKRTLNLERVRRLKFDASLMHQDPELASLARRAEHYVLGLVNELPQASSKFVPDSAELEHLDHLQSTDPQQFCQYQCCRLFHFVKKVYYKKLEKFEAVWDQDDVGRVWLIGAKIIELAEDLEGRLLSRKIQELRGGKTNLQMRELMQQQKAAQARERFRTGCASHFARMHKVAAFVHAKLPEQLGPGADRGFAEAFEAFYEPEFEAVEKALESSPKADYDQVLWTVLSISLMNRFPALSFLTNERLLRKFSELPVPRPERLEWRGKPKRRRSLGARALSVQQIQQILASLDEKKAFKRFPRYLVALQKSAENSLVLPRLEARSTLPPEAESREVHTLPASQAPPSPQPEAPRFPRNIQLFRVATSEAGFEEPRAQEAVPQLAGPVLRGEARRPGWVRSVPFAGAQSLPRILGRGGLCVSRAGV